MVRAIYKKFIASVALKVLGVNRKAAPAPPSSTIQPSVSGTEPPAGGFIPDEEAVMSGALDRSIVNAQPSKRPHEQGLQTPRVDSESPSIDSAKSPNPKPTRRKIFLRDEHRRMDKARAEAEDRIANRSVNVIIAVIRTTVGRTLKPIEDTTTLQSNNTSAGRKL